MNQFQRFEIPRIFKFKLCDKIYSSVALKFDAKISYFQNEFKLHLNVLKKKLFIFAHFL